MTRQMRVFALLTQRGPLTCGAMAVRLNLQADAVAVACHQLSQKGLVAAVQQPPAPKRAPVNLWRVIPGAEPPQAVRWDDEQDFPLPMRPAPVLAAPAPSERPRRFREIDGRTVEVVFDGA